MCHRVSRASLLTLGALCASALALAAQTPEASVPARCRGAAPYPFDGRRPADVVVRLMAEGEFPDEDAAAARALVALIREMLQERAPVSALTRIEVRGKVAASLVAMRDMRNMMIGGRLLAGVVQRKGDTVTVQWTVFTSGSPARPPAPVRASARIDDISRIALEIAKAALTAGAMNAELGSPPPGLGSVEAGEVYTIGLAEALSSTPAALSRARTALTRATELAPTPANVWRWRSRVEQLLVEWNRDPSLTALSRLQSTFVSTASQAATLAPRSSSAQLILADAHLAAGSRSLGEAALSAAIQLDGSSPGVLRRRASLSRIDGDDTRALQLLRDAVQLSPRDGPLLVELAMLARTRGDAPLACAALNAAVTVDDELAAAYALRALVRAENGERRFGWIDAEVATRLGHPEWGERVAAVLDVRYGDRAQAPIRLAPLGGVTARPTNYLDALLLAQAAVAISPRGEFSESLLLSWPCASLRRSALLRDLSAIGNGSAPTCAGAERPALTPRPRATRATAVKTAVRDAVGANPRR